jgi:hypothetical protein
MAARQIWLFLTDADVADLIARIDRREAGVVASQGRYLRGDTAALATDPTSLERRESMPGEARHYLFHRKHSADVVSHEQPAGPFQGWRQIDEERSDCLILRVPEPDGLDLGPSRVYASTSFWRGPTKIRKKPVFAVWANQTLRWLLGQYPSTAVDFMRIGPDALGRAQSGATRLTYLYRQIAPLPIAGLPEVAPPAGTLLANPGDEEEED